MPHSRPSQGVAVAIAIVAACLPPAARFLSLPSEATVHIRWQPSIDSIERRQLELHFRLADGRPHDEHTWRYVLTNLSRGNVRAIVLHPAVADTHYIDRTTYSVARPLPTIADGPQFGMGGDPLVRAADSTAVLLALWAVIVGVARARQQKAGQLLLEASRAGITVPRRSTAAFGAWLVRQVPELDAGALRDFRIVLGLGVLWVAWSMPIVSIPPDRLQHRAVIDLDFIDVVAASPQACGGVRVAMLACALLFTVGISSRLAWSAFVLAFFVATLVNLESGSAHDLGLPLITFLGWIAVPWGDAVRGRHPTARGPNHVYGFAIWWPGVTLGIALLAAAYAKIRLSGLAWITGGAVKYHFVTDADNAPVDWGLWVASHPSAAVLLSLAAIIIEATFILNVCGRGPWMRLAAGAAALGLFTGLYLFQGIYWPAWLVLLVAFLPWTSRNRTSDTHAHTNVTALPTLRRAQVAVVALVVCSQVYASAIQLEAEPVLSSFPMYSRTYASPAQFDEERRWGLTRLVEARADGKDITQAFQLLRDDDRRLLFELAEPGAGTGAADSAKERLRRSLFCGGHPQLADVVPAEITLTFERRGFEWHTGRFHDYLRLPTASIQMAALCREVNAVHPVKP